MPKHLYEGTDPLTNPHNTRPVGSGPFKFQEWLKGDHITLTRNDQYFKAGKPYLDRVVYRVMPSASAAAIAFEKGEVDYFLNPTPLDVSRLKNLPCVVISDKGREGYATVETLIPNLTHAPLNDLRVRRAMAHAIDKDFLVDKVLFGMGAPATAPARACSRGLTTRTWRRTLKTSISPTDCSTKPGSRGTLTEGVSN